MLNYTLKQAVALLLRLKTTLDKKSNPTYFIPYTSSNFAYQCAIKSAIING